jgi:hypothetical protein
VLRGEEPGLLVHVADRGEVAADDLKVGVLPDVVDGHLEHAEVEVGDGAERAARDEHDGLLSVVAEDLAEAVVGEGVVWGVVERGPRGGGGGGHGGRGRLCGGRKSGRVEEVDWSRTQVISRMISP